MYVCVCVCVCVCVLCWYCEDMKGFCLHVIRVDVRFLLSDDEYTINAQYPIL